jgi:hypothetical protein
VRLSSQAVVIVGMDRGVLVRHFDLLPLAVVLEGDAVRSPDRIGINLRPLEQAGGDVRILQRRPIDVLRRLVPRVAVERRDTRDVPITLFHHAAQLLRNNHAPD